MRDDKRYDMAVNAITLVFYSPVQTPSEAREALEDLKGEINIMLEVLPGPASEEAPDEDRYDETSNAEY